MSDLTNKLKTFFHSEHSKFKEFEQALTESQNATDWINAVNLFRAGMKKLKENDLTGLEEIKKSNEMLKAVVATHKKDEVIKEAQSLNEAIEKADVSKVDDTVETLGLHLGALYESLKAAGMPAMLNESELYEDCPLCEDDIASDLLSEPVVKEDSMAVSPDAQTPGAAPAPTSVAPVTSSTSAPTASPAMSSSPVAPVKESAYEHGFNEARKRWNKGTNPKASAKDIAEKELSQKPYSYVNRWMEGFVHGHSFHEETLKDIDPAMFQEEGKSPEVN